jgi:hypothetical protein
MSDEPGSAETAPAQSDGSVPEQAGGHHRVPDVPGAASDVAAFQSDRREEDQALAAERAREAGGPRFQWPSMLVVTGLVSSLLVVADDHFRRGSVLFAAFVVLAFFLRLILSDRDAGWLVVRSRAIDLVCLGVLGLSLSVFALVVPSPS